MMEQQQLATQKNKKGKKDDEQKEMEEKMKQEIKKLGDEMEMSLLGDRESNKNHKPAILRFKLLKKIENTLRKPFLW